MICYSNEDRSCYTCSRLVAAGAVFYLVTVGEVTIVTCLGCGPIALGELE